MLLTNNRKVEGLLNIDEHLAKHDSQVVRTLEFWMNTPKCVLGIRIAAYVVIT